MSPTETFVDALAGGHAEWRSAIRAGAVIFVTALTAAAAQISVPLPFTAVPFTFQPMVVLLGGLALGSTLGMTSQVLYLFAGIVGLPVFAASATLPPGALRLLGPTGGYLMAYPFAALLTGYLSQRGVDRRYATAAIVEAVAAAVADLEIPLLVVDPVMIAKSGDALVDDEAVATIRTELLRHARVVTPNIPEAEVLSGMTIRSDEDRRRAARSIAALGPAAVILKGGHYPSSDIVDLLYDGERFRDFRSERIAGTSTHGTGCTFAAALAARLALGDLLEDAVPKVQQYVAGAIRNAPGLGRGHGPMNHFWSVY